MEGNSEIYQLPIEKVRMLYSKLKRSMNAAGLWFMYQGLKNLYKIDANQPMNKGMWRYLSSRLGRNEAKRRTHSPY